jgi:hypothetical protein
MGGRLLEQPQAAAARILKEIPKMFLEEDLRYDPATLDAQAALLTSVTRLWQRFPGIAVESAGEMQARITQGVCDVADFYLQVCSALEPSLPRPRRCPSTPSTRMGTLRISRSVDD